MKLPIYLDYAATCPVDPRVAEKMINSLTLDGNFANPASRSHKYGWQAEEAVDIARNQIAELVNADAREIVFTSGATESDNLAIKGVALAYQNKGKHLITVMTEHKAVLDSCHYLETLGFDITYLKPNSDGLITAQQVENALRDDTILVSVMQVNNEIGVIQDITSIGEVCHKHQVFFHVDATQSVGKLAINLATLPVNLMSFSAHKVYGPKGIGALYVSRRSGVKLTPIIHGGGHEKGMRSGTLPLHQIVGMGAAYELCRLEMTTEMERITQLQKRLLAGIEEIDGVYLNGSAQQRIATNLNFAFDGVDGDMLVVAMKDLAVSSGSACTSASVDPSYVLKAIGLSDELALSSLRFSLGRFTTEEEIDFAIDAVKKALNTIRVN